MKELARYKNIIAALLIIFVSAILLRSIHTHYSLRIKNFAADREKIKEANELVANWLNLNNEYEQLKGQFLAKDTLLFKKLVEEKARNFNIELPSLQLSSRDKDYYWEVEVNIRTSCAYEEFVGFVNSMAEKKIEVVNAELSGKDSEVLVSANIMGVVLK